MSADTPRYVQRKARRQSYLSLNVVESYRLVINARETSCLATRKTHATVARPAGFRVHTPGAKPAYTAYPTDYPMAPKDRNHRKI